jgi:hypothetical protein
MDPEAKEEFRWKFYLLAVQMNAIVFIVALTLMAAWIAPEPFRIPLILFLIVLAAYLSISFYRKYNATKSWLDEHTDKEKPQ